MAWRWILLCIFILLAVGVFWWVSTGDLEQEYAARIRKLRRQGGPVMLQDFATPPVPDDWNFAVVLREAARELEEHRRQAGEPFLLDQPREMWGDFAEEERRRADRYVAGLEPVLARVERGYLRPLFRQDRDWDRGFEMDRALSEMSSLGRAFERAALVPEDSSTLSRRVVRSARGLLALADQCSPPFIRGDLLRRALRMSAVAIVSKARARPGFDVARVRAELVPLLAAAEQPAGPPVDVLLQERAVGLWVFERRLAGGPAHGSADG
ncbi:MAG: hypothetical protein ACE5JG_10885, partial [Planctomycetota bacterium]